MECYVKLPITEEEQKTFLTFSEKGKPNGLIDANICKYILSKVPIFIINRSVYIYKDGLYKKDKHLAALKSLVQQCIPSDLWRISRINAIVELIINQYQLHIEEQSELNNHSGLINFKNGMLNIKEMRLEEHSPSYMGINQIPHDFIPYSERDFEERYYSSNLYRFLSTTIPDEEDLEMLFQFLGCCLMPETLDQKFLILLGPGGLGKSVLIGLAEKMVGTKNVSSVPLHDLTKRFYATCLYQKLLNTSGDISKEDIENVEAIKRITGEDQIQGEYKGKDPFFFKSYANLLFSANEIPRVPKERTNAFYRRLMVLNIEQRGVYIESVKEVLEKEIHLLLYLAVKGLQKVYENNCRIVESGRSKRTVEKLYSESDAVSRFLEYEKAKGTLKGRVEKSNVYNSYCQFCNNMGVRPILSKKSFSKRITELGFMTMRSNSKDYLLFDE